MGDVDYIPKFWTGQKVVTKGGRRGKIVGQKTIYQGKVPSHVYFVVLTGNKSRTTVKQESIDKIYIEQKNKAKN